MLALYSERVMAPEEGLVHLDVPVWTVKLSLRMPRFWAKWLDATHDVSLSNDCPSSRRVPRRFYPAAAHRQPTTRRFPHRVGAYYFDMISYFFEMRRFSGGVVSFSSAVAGFVSANLRQLATN